MKKSQTEVRYNNRESFKRLINLGLVVFGFALEVTIFAYNWLEHFQPSVVSELRYFYRKGHIAEIIIYAAFLFLLERMYGGMRLGYLRNGEIIFSQIFATLFANVLIYIELSVMAFQAFVPKMFIVMTLEQALVIFLYTEFANGIYLRIFPARKLLLIHDHHSIEGIMSKFADRKDKYKIVADANVSMGTKALCELIDKGVSTGIFSGVVLWDIPVNYRNRILKYCYGRDIRVYMMPKITDVIIGGAEDLHVFDSPMLLTREYSMSMEERIAKRAIDIFCSAILIIIGSPFMILTAIAVKCYDGGPIL